MGRPALTVRGLGRALDAVSAAGAVWAITTSAHAIVNQRLLRRPSPAPPPVAELVSVGVPARNEAHRITPCIRSLLAQRGVPDLEILVLDDGSTDDTAAVTIQAAAGDGRLRVLTGTVPPPGWLGKPHACSQLAGAARGTVMVFVDADVELAPDALATAVSTLRAGRWDLVSLWPRQLAVTPAERLIQPLLAWCWLTALPLRLAEALPFGWLGAANGQFICLDIKAYERAGGHGTVRGEVVDDIALSRAVKRAGGRSTIVDGTALASCRMYENYATLREGYSKSLWWVFGTRVGTAAALSALAATYLLPPLAALRGSRLGLAGYAAAVTSRAIVARRVGDRAWPDSLAHPAAIALVGWLTVRSWHGRRLGTLTWKDRTL